MSSFRDRSWYPVSVRSKLKYKATMKPTSRLDHTRLYQVSLEDKPAGDQATNLSSAQNPATGSSSIEKVERTLAFYHHETRK